MTIYAHTNVFIWNVQSIIIHNNPKGNYEKTFNWKMAKRIMAILYNGILLNNKKKQITHMYKHRWIKNPCTKLKKLDTNQNKTKPCIYMVLFVWHSAKVKIIKMGIMVVAMPGGVWIDFKGHKRMLWAESLYFSCGFGYLTILMYQNSLECLLEKSSFYSM